MKTIPIVFRTSKQAKKNDTWRFAKAHTASCHLFKSEQGTKPTNSDGKQKNQSGSTRQEVLGEDAGMG